MRDDYLQRLTDKDLAAGIDEAEQREREAEASWSDAVDDLAALLAEERRRKAEAK